VAPPHKCSTTCRQHTPTHEPLIAICLTHRGLRLSTHAYRTGSGSTDSAYYTFWQQILGDTEGTISNAYLTSRAITHAQRRTVLKYRYGQLWNNKLALGTNSATPTNAHCATKLTEAATSPQVAKTPS
jgi:hypothetical protein